MKHIILSFISIGLLITPITCESWIKKTNPTRSNSETTRDIDGNTPALNSVSDLLQLHVLKYPDNVSKATLIVSGTTGAAALATYFLASKILDLPLVGRALQSVGKNGLKLVDPKDLLEGLSFVVGVSGALGLYENATELRQKFLGSFMSILMAKQVAEPHTVGDKEVMNSALQALALLHLLGTAENLVSPIVEKSVARAMTKVYREQMKLADKHDY